MESASASPSTSKRVREASTANAKEQSLTELFDGKKSKWLPLYYRLLARFSNVTGIEFFPFKNSIAIGHKNDDRPTMGEIKVTPRGLEVGLGLASAVAATAMKLEKKATSQGANSHTRLRASNRNPRWITHRVLIAKASEIDEEFMAWVKAARHQARIARPRST